jgi:uncharacterized protein YuzE
MILRVDQQSNAVYIDIEEDRSMLGPVDTHVCDAFLRGGSVHLDIDANGRLVGIEILGISNILSSAALAALLRDSDGV